ncbi:MAG: hypothetical protein MJ239_05145, partial [Bacilli bacterium]|nr:hypothetical protein [Bacilli bacterium]
INVCIPVSLNDLAFQLYWYGYRIDIQNIFESEVPVEELPQDQHHQIGTHPNTEDIKAIRETEIAKGLSVNMFEEYRDYHTLTMGLRK